ncbi:MAG TPA: YebC/PmpR family DNA-binding transcriptional regulator [Actinomycetota bacterium]
MSGHSKWATIKRKKGANDAKRSNTFAKLLRAVEVAAREGGSGDPKANMTLASAVEKARSFSVPADNIERAIKRGTGELGDGARYEEITYEGYAPGGIALVVEALTDNRNRTAQDVRHAFSRNAGNLGETGSTRWMFERKGVIVVEKAAAPDEEGLLELALEGGADDLRDAESSWEILTAPQDFKAVEEALRGAGVPVFSAEISMMPTTTIPVDGAEAKRVLQLIEALEDLDDVQNVYANFDIPEEVMASL